MVKQHYRWDFIGLSTDTKPTPATSEKVVDGSTFYCSDTSKLYVYCKDNWYERKPLGGGGGGTTYTAGDGINISDDTISVDTTTIQPKLTAGSNINISDNTISSTDTTYSNFTGTDGTAAGSAGLVPAPATTDAGKFLKADGTWDSTGGGGDTVYSTKTTSNSSTGGAVYIGNLDTNQDEQADPTTTDNHYKYFWTLPSSNSYIPENNSINIFGERARSGSIVIGNAASDTSNTSGSDNILFGSGASTSGNSHRNIVFGVNSYAGSGSNDTVSIGNSAHNANYVSRSVALGSHSEATRNGEVNIGNINGSGYNNTNYRVIGGVHDGQLANDAVTVGQVNALIDAINTALSTNIPHIGATS